MKRRQGTAANPFRQHKGLSRRPSGLRAGPAAGAVRSLRPGDSLTPAFWGQSGFQAPSRKNKQRRRHSAPQILKGVRAEAAGLPTGRSPPARRLGEPRGAASLCPSGANSALDPQTPRCLPFSVGPPSRAGVASTSPELTFQSRAAGRPSVSPEFRPHTASSGSRRKQLQSGTGSLAAPHQHTHSLSSPPRRWYSGRGADSWAAAESDPQLLTTDAHPNTHRIPDRGTAAPRPLPSALQGSQVHEI